jgi:hypothetical protein
MIFFTSRNSTDGLCSSMISILSLKIAPSTALLMKFLDRLTEMMLMIISIYILLTLIVKGVMSRRASEIIEEGLRIQGIRDVSEIDFGIKEPLINPLGLRHLGLVQERTSPVPHGPMI